MLQIFPQIITYLLILFILMIFAIEKYCLLSNMFVFLFIESEFSVLIKKAFFLPRVIIPLNFSKSFIFWLRLNLESIWDLFLYMTCISSRWLAHCATSGNKFFFPAKPKCYLYGTLSSHACWTPFLIF